MTFARDERRSLCDTLQQVGPDAPTLCAGWTTYDLAAHLWVRENQAPKMLAVMANPRVQESAILRATKARHSYDELVELVRRGPSGASPFRIVGVDSLANSVEMFVHHEDVRRAGNSPAAPRTLGEDAEDTLWKALRRMAPLLYRRSRAGVDLRTPDGRTLPVRKNRRIGVTGPVGELVLFSTGRTRAAHVDLSGDARVIPRLTESLGM